MPQDITSPNNNPNLGLVMAQVDDADGKIVVKLIELLARRKENTWTHSEVMAFQKILEIFNNLETSVPYEEEQARQPAWFDRLDDGGAE